MDFKPIAIQDGKRFREYAKASSFMGTEVCFTDMFSWGRAFGCEVCFEDDFAFLRGVPGGREEKAFYHFPFGKGKLKPALEKVISLAEQTKNRRLTAIDDNRKAILEEMFPGKFEFTERRDRFDYIYASASLATLSGKALHAKKNHLNKFLKSHEDYRVEELSPANYGDCLAINREWCRKRRADDPNAPSCEEGDEFCAVRRTLDHYGELGCYGILLKIADKPVAFTIGTPVRDDLFVTHFEKALTDYPGAFAAINNFFARRLQKYQYINREEDLGIEGLRKAKMGYNPEILYRKYDAKIIS